MITCLSIIHSVLHLTNHTPSTASLQRNLVQAMQSLPSPERFSTQLKHITNIDIVRVSLELQSPLTILVVANTGWGGIILDENYTSSDNSSSMALLLQDHMFSAVWSCEQLSIVAAGGGNVISVTNKVWRLSQPDDMPYPCFEYGGSNDGTLTIIRSCVLHCDIIAKNGIAQMVDRLLVDPTAVKLAPPTLAPTAAPTSTPMPTLSLAPSAAPTDALQDLDMKACRKALLEADEDKDGAIRRPEFYGFVAKYSASKCYPVAEQLTDEQLDLFQVLACECALAIIAPFMPKSNSTSNSSTSNSSTSSTSGNTATAIIDPTAATTLEEAKRCCQGTAAYLDLQGTAVPDTDAYLEKICVRTDRSIGVGILCPSTPGTHGNSNSNHSNSNSSNTTGNRTNGNSNSSNSNNTGGGPAKKSNAAQLRWGWMTTIPTMLILSLWIMR